MAQHAQAFEHRAAKHNRIKHRCAGNIFNDVRLAGFYEHFAHWFNQARPFVGVAVALGKVRIGLARR